MKTLFYYNKYKLREEMREFFRIPFVFKRSARLYRMGLLEPYYIDFDLIINDPYRCEQVAKFYSIKIIEISKQRPVELLAFIEKYGGGTFGAVRLAGLISTLTKIPNVLVRLTRELEYEQVKVPPIAGKTLKGRLSDIKTTIITDHISTGTELLDAIDAMEFNGGKVTDVVAYTVRMDKVRKEEFTRRGTELHPLFELPNDLPEELKRVAIAMTERNSFSKII